MDYYSIITWSLSNRNYNNSDSIYSVQTGYYRVIPCERSMVRAFGKISKNPKSGLVALIMNLHICKDGTLLYFFKNDQLPTPKNR